MCIRNTAALQPKRLLSRQSQVYWNEKKVGTTARIDDTLDPVWDLEIFAIKVDAEGPNSVEQATLRIDCLDWDQFGSNDVLGQVELKGWQIKELAEKNISGGGGGGDGGVGGDSDEGDVLSEADVEAIYEFVQKFQQQQESDGGAGGMVVGVPQEERRKKKRGKNSFNGAQVDGGSMAGEGATGENDENMDGDGPKDVEMGKERGDKCIAEGASKPKRNKANSKRAAGKKARAVQGGHSASPSEARTVSLDRSSKEQAVEHKTAPSVDMAGDGAAGGADPVQGESVLKGEHANLGEKVAESAEAVAGNEIGMNVNPTEKDVSSSQEENGGVDTGSRVTAATETRENPRTGIGSCTRNDPTTGSVIENSGNAEGDTVAHAALPPATATHEVLGQERSAGDTGEQGTGAKTLSQVGTVDDAAQGGPPQVDVTTNTIGPVDSAAGKSGGADRDTANNPALASVASAENGATEEQPVRSDIEEKGSVPDTSGVAGTNVEGAATTLLQAEDIVSSGETKAMSTDESTLANDALESDGKREMSKAKPSPLGVGRGSAVAGGGEAARETFEVAGSLSAKLADGVKAGIRKDKTASSRAIRYREG